MIKIAIIEDEAIAVRNLLRLLSGIPFEFRVVAKIESVTDAIAILPELEIDLIFMDIHLTDGNAFQIFQSIKITSPIIFTTAFDQYTLKAFKQNSVDYLLKPIDKTELKQAVQKFNNLFLSQQKTPDTDYQSLVKLLTTNNHYKKRFLVQIGKKMRPLEIKEIAYFFVKDKTTYLRTLENKTYLIDYSLSELEKQLDPDIFYRINRQYIIANQAIVDIYYLSTIRLKVNLNPPSKEDILVTIDKIAKFKKWLNR